MGALCQRPPRQPKYPLLACSGYLSVETSETAKGDDVLLRQPGGVSQSPVHVLRLKVRVPMRMAPTAGSSPPPPEGTAGAAAQRRRVSAGRCSRPARSSVGGDGGEGGIRTLGTREGSLDFESSPFGQLRHLSRNGFYLEHQWGITHARQHPKIRRHCTLCFNVKAKLSQPGPLTG